MSIEGQYDDDNIFAKIIRGEMPCVKVYEDEHILAFMDVFPQSEGHTLVIPKNEKARNLLDAGPKALGRMIGTVQKISRAVNTALNPDGIVVTQFNGAAAGQTVFHLHMHIIPRYEGAGLAGHAGSSMADMNELAALAEKIKAAL
jgi:histidine triad (HIT) family protein